MEANRIVLRMAPGERPPLQLVVDGEQVEVPDRGASLLEVLREDLGRRSAKDGCSPQGQCGCCTVLVDGQPRVACVTPARRVAGRSVTTVIINSHFDLLIGFIVQLHVYRSATCWQCIRIG